MRRFCDSVSNHPLIAKRPAVRQFFKFGLVGALNTVLDYLIFTVLFTWGHVFYLIANVISFSVAVINSYILNRRWTYRSAHPNWKGEGLKYLIVYTIGLGISELLLFIFVEHLHLHQLIAKVFTIGIVIFWNYFGTRSWVFRHHTTPSFAPFPPPEIPINKVNSPSSEDGTNPGRGR